MELLSCVQLSPAICKDRAGICTFIHYPEAPGLPYGKVGSLWIGNKEI